MSWILHAMRFKLRGLSGGPCKCHERGEYIMGKKQINLRDINSALALSDQYHLQYEGEKHL